MAQEQITSPQVHAIILAAGLSTRMGGYPKALLPVHSNKTMLELAVCAFHDAGISSLFVVTGHMQQDVGAFAKSLNARPVFNPEYHKGMLSSVHAGITALPSSHAPPSAFFLLPVDAPLVLARTIQDLVKMWHDGTNNTNTIILPTFYQQTGHPPLIGNGHWQAILDWQGTNGLRGYFASLLPAEDAPAFLAGNIPERQTHSPTTDDHERHSLLFHPVADAGILGDIDTPEELAKAAQAFPV